MDTTGALTTLLQLPYAKQVLAFEEIPLNESSPVYEGICPYTVSVAGGVGYVRWGIDSLERLLALPHEEVLDEALMRLAVHTGEASDCINMLEIRDDLRWLCAQLRLAPPKGTEAVKLYILGILEDLVHGVIPAERTRKALTCLHGLVFENDCGKALDHISFFYWQVDEWDDLSLLGLEQGLLSYDEIRLNFLQYAEELVRSMEVVMEQRDGLWYIQVE